MKHLNKLIINSILLAGVMLISGCSFMKISMEPVLNRFDVPEVEGELGKVSFQSNTSDAVEVSMGELHVGLLSDNELDDTDRMEKTFTMGMNLGVGLTESVDVYVHFQGRAPGMIGLKTDYVGQILQKKNSKWRATTSFAIGAGGVSSEMEESTGNSYSSEVDSLAFDASMNLGYRFRENILLYVNSFYSKYESSGDIHHNNQLVLSDSGNGTAYGFLPGIMLGDKEGFSFIIEAGKSWVDWSGLPGKSFDTYGTSIKYTW